MKEACLKFLADNGFTFEQGVFQEAPNKGLFFIKASKDDFIVIEFATSIQDCMYELMIESVKKKLRNVYVIDLKVYESALQSEIPWRLPDDCWNAVGRLRVDYHTICLELTEEEFEQFCAWFSEHEIIAKVIGTEKQPTKAMDENWGIGVFN